MCLEIPASCNSARSPCSQWRSWLTDPTKVDLKVSTNLPNYLVWRGTNADWTTSTSKNWYDVNSALMTNYADGDFVTFDGNTSYPTNINVAGSQMVPSGVTITNSTSYIFSGAGSLQGNGTWTKWGSGTVQVDGASTLPMQVNQGRLTGAGTNGVVTIASGAAMNFSGTIAGGLECAGIATSSGSIVGPVTVQTGGVVTNSASGTIGGSLSFQPGALLYNAGNITNIGASTVASNATLINAKNITGTRLGVSGTFIDTGGGSITLDGTTPDGVLTINGGTGTNNVGAGTFIPGGDGIGTTRVLGGACPPSGSCYAGRVTFAAGSTNIFKVDLTNPTNCTKLESAHMSFGPNQSLPKQFNGGTILVTNIGPTPLGASQTFQMFVNSTTHGAPIFDAGLNTTNSYPVMAPLAPGLGMAWDLSNLMPNGYVGIIGVATNRVSFTYSFTSGLNTTTNSTNAVIISQFQWPTDHIGWRLESQSNPLNIGISNNWATVFDSVWTNSLVITNNLVTNSATFYRMTLPVP